MTANPVDAPAWERAWAIGPAEIERRAVRYADLVPCLNAFIDTRTPGSETKENFTIIGPGVSENPDQHIHISEPHGFNIGGARQPPFCANSQHSHLTAEVFVVHSGRWRFDFGETGQDASVEGAPGDVVSFPTNTFRGFTNIGDDSGFLWSVLGGDDPGHVTWAPRVFELAQRYGLVLMEDGSLVDTAAGKPIPAGVARMPETTAKQAAALRRMTDRDAAGLIAPATLPAAQSGGLTAAGVTETPIIGFANAAEATAEAPLAWPHGFALRRLDFGAGAATPRHMRDEAEVLFVHAGSITAEIADNSAQFHAGDTLTVPIGASRRYTSDSGARVFVVRGGDYPQAARVV